MRFIFSAIILAFLISCTTPSIGHFYDEAGSSLEQYDDIWNDLHSFFGGYLPKKIKVRYRCSGGASYFSNVEAMVTIDPAQDAPHEVLLAHETAHIAMDKMTNGISFTEPFSFIDEGWASIVGSISIGKGVDYKNNSLKAAKLKKSKDEVSFDKVQDWKSYFGDRSVIKSRSKQNFDAYRVGSTFLYYIIDNYGEDFLRRFFIDIGKTKSLSESLKNILGKSKSEVEKEWLDYIDEQHKD